MTQSVALPLSLQTRLTALARRVRMVRAIRGIGLLGLSLALTAGAALVGDYLFDLPPLVRQAIFIAWTGLGFGLFCHAFFLPIFRRFDYADLAAVVEQKYPGLGERLTSTVELAGQEDLRHGAPALVGLLVEDTEKRTRPLNFLPAIPTRAATGLCLAATIAVALLVAPGFAWPQEYADLAHRFLRPWSELPPYTFVVAPGDVVAAKGSSVAITVTVHPRTARIALPASTSLVLTDAEGHETSQRMRADRSDAFSFPLKVIADGQYRVEARAAVGDTVAASASHPIVAVTPVELAADNPVATVTPPEYARATWDEETRTGLVDLIALQGSDVRFQLRFTRPAVAAWLEWSAADFKEGKEGTKATAKVTTHALPLTAEGTAAEWTLPARATGSYRLILEAEHGIRTERDGGMLTVKADLPPAVLRFTGREELKAVTPREKVALECGLADDVGVARADLEYRINDDEPVRLPFNLTGTGRLEASGQLLFELAGKVKEGDKVAYRLRVEDNLPAALQGPHVVYAPADRWLTLMVAKQTSPLREQEIALQRDALDRRLDAIKQALLQEMRGVYKVQNESRADDSLTPEQRDALKALEGENRDTEKALRELVQEADTTPALQPIAEKARDVADREMQKSEADLREASVAKKTGPARDASFKDADKQLANAVQKLEDLKKLNDQIAKDRTDQMRVETLAARQQELAEKAAELAKKDPVRDATAKDEAEQLKKEQGDVANELKKLTENSPALQKALDEARAEQTRQAAERASELAEAQRELASAQAETEKDRQAARFSELAKRQEELARKAADLADETKQSARTARAQPLKPDDARKAAEALKEGNPTEAVKHQDQTARELDRLASEFDKAIDLAKDPREAAKQLARLQDDLRQRVQDEMHKRDADKPLEQRLAGLRKEQELLQKATKQLTLPPQNELAKQERKNAAEQAERATDLLAKRQPREALGPMEQSKQALERLAEKLPTLEQRQQLARQEVARLRQQQEHIAQLTEQVQSKKDNPQDREQKSQKLAEAAKRQAEVAEAVSKLDAPRQEERRARSEEALNQALADLMDARPEDVNASQQQAKRELERLEQALAGQKPADEKARELARKQQELANEAAMADKASPLQKAVMQGKQQELAREATNLPVPEAPQRHAEAVEAARAAEKAANADPTSAEAKQQMESAARKLDELAKQLNGQEKDAARADRLAKRQAEAARDAERQAQADPNARPTPEAQRRQEEIAREVKQVRGGEEARAEKRRSEEALNKAQQANNAGEQAKAQRESADALRNLADRLAGRKEEAKPGETSARDAAKQLAKEQRDLAKATQQAQQQAAQQGGEAGKKSMQQAMEKAAQKQGELNQKAARLGANQAQKGLEQARAAMNQAQQALGKSDAAQANQKQTEAADALDRLAKQLPKEAPSRASKEQPEGANPAPQGLPTKGQAERAQQLAQEQRDLRDAVRKAGEAARADNAPPPRENPVGELAKQQADIAKQAGELAQDVAKAQGQQSGVAQQGQKAGQAAQEASSKMQAGALPQAQQAGKQTAERLRQLAQDLSQTPRGNNEQPGSDPVQQARDLAKKQEAINRRAEALVGNPDAARSQQQARQQDLEKQAGDLAKDLNKMAGEMARSPQAQQAARQASQAGQEAQGQMQQAQAQGRQGNQGPAQQAQQQAAQSLDRAAQQAARAAAQQAASNQAAQSPQGSPQAGQSVQQAQGQMQQAQGQLGQGQAQGAQQSMQGAAQALQQAAQQLAQGSQPGQPGQQNQAGKPNQPGSPGEIGAAGGGVPDPSVLSPEMRKHAGKSWGELPGELRTKIVQDMKVKYGEDYARMIKLYFEQLADTKRDAPKK